MSSRRSPASILAPLRRGSPPRPAVSSPAGRRAGSLSFGLTLLGALGSGWCLISTGRALGALLRSSSAAGLLAQALAAAALSAVCQLLAQRVARFSAITEEAHLRRLTLAHLLGLGPARAADVRSGATASLLTDGAERVALYRQTFLAPTLAAAAAPLLVLIELAVVVDVVPALVLAAAVIMVPAFIIWCHSRLRASSSDSRRARMRLAAEYLDAIQGLRTLTLARAAERTSARLRLEGESNRRAVMGLLAGNQLVILLTDGLFSLFLITVAAGLALVRLSSGAIDISDALAIVLTSYVLLEPLAHVGAFFSWAWAEWPTSGPSAGFCRALCHTPPRVPEPGPLPQRPRSHPSCSTTSRPPGARTPCWRAWT